MTEQKTRESSHGKYSFSAKIQNGRLSAWGVFLNARNCGTKYDINTVNVSFSTDNRMADLLYNYITKVVRGQSRTSRSRQT